MTVRGIGIDVCDVDRFRASLERTPALRDKVFTQAESTRDGVLRPIHSLAARFAAKEALAKALGAPAGLEWHDCEVVTEPSGQPRFELRGTVAARAAELGVNSVHLSLTHDAGVSQAMVVLEG
ncbi:holo-ACP synthase [Nocardioides yefusunii]|uniref:Holo-[acyl-carrier-protein] synthase n=1 Tax=Nocardioides yefusunii TaxID=2500546 RepID=A0ABW1R155_9ACTN|nr:holo-ACP synthase [Nocardioides yefusunii]